MILNRIANTNREDKFIRLYILLLPIVKPTDPYSFPTLSMQRNLVLATPLMATQPISTGRISTKPLGNKTRFLLKAITIKIVILFTLKLKSLKSSFKHYRSENVSQIRVCICTFNFQSQF